MVVVEQFDLRAWFDRVWDRGGRPACFRTHRDSATVNLKQQSRKFSEIEPKIAST